MRKIGSHDRLVDPRNQLQQALGGLRVSHEYWRSHQIIDHRLKPVSIGVYVSGHRHLIGLDCEQRRPDYGQRANTDHDDRSDQKYPLESLPTLRPFDCDSPLAHPRFDAASQVSITIGSDGVTGRIVLDEHDRSAAVTIEITFDVHSVWKVIVVEANRDRVKHNRVRPSRRFEYRTGRRRSRVEFELKLFVFCNEIDVDVEITGLGRIELGLVGDGFVIGLVCWCRWIGECAQQLGQRGAIRVQLVTARTTHAAASASSNDIGSVSSNPTRRTSLRSR